MSLFLTVLQALAPLFLLILLGFLLRRYAKLLHLHHVPVLNGLVINVTLPALIFGALLKTPDLSSSLELLPVALFAAEMITMLAVLGLGRALRLSRPTQGMLMMTSCFGNTAFLGYPITLSLLPKLFPAAVLLDQFGMTMIMLLFAVLIGGTFGSATVDRDARLVAIRRFLRSPLLLAAIGGIVVRSIPWPAALTNAAAPAAIGKAIAQTLTYLGQGTTPLVLLALGAALRPRNAYSALRTLALPAFFKLLLCPALMFAFCWLLGLRGDFLRIGVLSASMPTSVTASVLCAQNDLDGELASGVVFVTTAVSIATIPLLVWFVQGHALFAMLK